MSTSSWPTSCLAVHEKQPSPGVLAHRQCRASAAVCGFSCTATNFEFAERTVTISTCHLTRFRAHTRRMWRPTHDLHYASIYTVRAKCAHGSTKYRSLLLYVG